MILRKCGKKTFSMIIIFLLLLVTFALSSTYSVIKLIQSKTIGVELTIKQMIDLYDHLTEFCGLTKEQIKELEDLKINEYGFTYGPDVYDCDLVSVVSDQGHDGYVYNKELYQYSPTNMGFTNPEDAVKWQKQFMKEHPSGYIVPVYKSDGRTKIGTFTIR